MNGMLELDRPIRNGRVGGRFASSGSVNALADAVRQQTHFGGLGHSPDPLGAGWHFIGEVTDKGPNGEADLPGAMHWVAPRYFTAAKSDQPCNLNEIKTDTLRITTDPVVPVMNLAGRFAGGASIESAHSAQKGQYVFVRAVLDAGGNVARHHWIMFAVPMIVPTILLTDGGTDGNATTAASYTYTLTQDGTTNTAFAHNVAPSFQRPNGFFLSASIGLAVYRGGAWRLWWADEVPNTGYCSA